MRNLILIACVAMGLASCQVPKDYVGKVEQKHVVFNESFSGIKVSQAIEVEITPGSKNEADVTSDAMEKLVMEVEGNTLNIHYERGFLNNLLNSPKTTIKLTAKSIDDFRASSSASIKVNGQFSTRKAEVSVSSSADVKYNFKGESMNIDASSSGDFVGDVEVSSLVVSASSSAGVVLEGLAYQSDFSASSSGSVKAPKLYTEIGKAKASSSGSVSVAVLKEMDAQASSSGRVYLSGEADKADFSASSSGSIKAMDLETKFVNAGVTSGGRVEASVSEELDAVASSGGDIIYREVAGKRPRVSVRESSGGNVYKR